MRVFFSLGLLVAAAAGLSASDTKPVSGLIAEVDGVRLTLADLEQKRPAALFQARNGFYEAQKKVVEEFIGEYLLERQAKKEGVSVGELLERHVNRAIPADPSDEALRVYYEGVDTTEPFESARDKIRDYLRQRRIAKAKNTYLQSLRSQAQITIRIDSPRANVSLKDTPIRGAVGAPVLLVEFADYECPYCQVAYTEIEKLRAEYKDKVAFAFKDMPLAMHANAQKASEAAHCAGTLGKYWEYHDLLFKAKQLDLKKLKDNARELKLDAESFDRCLDSGQQAAGVKAQMAEGVSLGLEGTPGLFINGRYFKGVVKYDTLRQIVEEELALSAGSRADRPQMAESASR